MTTLKLVALSLLLLTTLVGAAQAVPSTVWVRNAGNAGELSGINAPGGAGTDRTCGAVGYNYKIGKYEVSAGEYSEFLNKVAGVDTYDLYSPDMWTHEKGCKIERYLGSGTVGDPYKYRVSTAYAGRPVNFVSWGDAARYTNWLQNHQPSGLQDLTTTEDGAYLLDGALTNAALMAVARKPTWEWAIANEDEWYKAAYHKNNGVTGDYYDYSASNDSPPTRDLLDPLGNNANWGVVDASSQIDPGYYTTVGGEFQKSLSPYGTYDQGGNVWEWTEMSLSSNANRQCRGGAFVTATVVGLRASRRSGQNSPTTQIESVGFRVVQLPEPASILLIPVAAAVCASRKTRASSNKPGKA